MPGGSSGGPAAAVAAGSVPLAFGSDTGGSIRQPAALCGMVGVKPTYGRVSRYGLVAFASSLDQIGPIARNVRDAALGLQVIAGDDPRDATSAGRAGRRLPGADRGGDRRPQDRRPARDRSSPASAATSPATGASRSTGSPRWERSWSRSRCRASTAAIAVYYVIATSEASANLARFDGVRYGRRSPEADNLADLYFESRSEGFGAEVKRRIMLGTFALSSGYYEAYYGRARGVLERMRHELDAAFGKADLLVTPTTPSAAFRLGEKVDDPLAMYLSDIFTTPANLTGADGDRRALRAPTPTACRCRSRSSAPASARPAMFRAARAFEREVGWTVAPSFRGAEAA